eukprot:3070390-Pleurochrysis_carterae.AAC.1
MINDQLNDVDMHVSKRSKATTARNMHFKNFAAAANAQAQGALALVAFQEDTKQRIARNSPSKFPDALFSYRANAV